MTGTSQQLDVAVNLSTGQTGLNLATSAQPNGTTVTAIGYPAASPYDGKNLTYCQGPVGRDSEHFEPDLQVVVPDDRRQLRWALGAQRWHGLQRLGRRRSNSYGYTGDADMYGPIFGSDTLATFSLAQTKTSGNFAINAR